MSFCDKNNPCATCKWSNFCNILEPYVEINREIAISKREEFGCWSWELRDDLIEEQIKRNAEAYWEGIIGNEPNIFTGKPKEE
jgi:hypothetical protein